MDYINKLIGSFTHTGGARKQRKSRRRAALKGGAECETGEACNAAFTANTSLSQGEDFAKMTRAFHGGRKTRKMMRGGALAELADYQTAFDILPEDLAKVAGTTVLDQNIADAGRLTTPQAGGAKKSRKGRKGTKKTRKMRGGYSLSPAPIDAPTMLLEPTDYQQAFLNPQWETENIVNPNFDAPLAVPGADAQAGVQAGGAKKSRKAAKKSRNAAKKSRNAAKKSRKAAKKSRKAGGAKKGRKAAKKGRKATKKGRKGSRKH